ncbi:MAG: hypothetical protein AAF389_18545 [Gemmatimonadota bacterium]
MTRGRPAPQRFGVSLLAVLFWGCGSDDAAVSGRALDDVSGVPTTNLTSQCVSDFDPEVDYFPDKVTVERAATFTVGYHGHYKVLRSSLRAEAWGGSLDDVAVLVQCGTPVPDLTGELEGAVAIEVPVTTVAANFLDDIARIRTVGMADRLVAIGDGRIYDPEIRARWERGELLTLGHAFHAGGDTEQLLIASPDIFLANIAGPDPLENMRSLGVSVVPTLGWAEPDYLGRAEWTKHAALFFNAEVAANDAWSALRANVDSLRSLTAELEERPSVMWTVNRSADRWSAFRSSYENGLIIDAGGRNIFFAPGNDGLEASLQSVDLTPESMLEQADGVEVWLASGRDDRDWPTGPVLNSFRAYRDGRVYHRSGRTIPDTDANDWNETGSVRPDLILRDLIHLVHPDVLPDHELMFFREVELTKRSGR